RVPLERPRRPGRDRRIRGADDQGATRPGRADLRHLPRPPDARPRRGGEDRQDAPGPPRGEPPGQAPRGRRGRDHLDEPRLRGRQFHAARGGGGDPRVAVRRLELRHRDQGQEGVRRAVPPRGEPGAARQLLPVREVRGDVGVRELGAILMLAFLTGNTLPPSREAIEADANRIVQQCKADYLIEVTVDDASTIKLKLLKNPNERTEADLEALRCAGRQKRGAVDFRPSAETLATLKAADAQSHSHHIDRYHPPSPTGRGRGSGSAP